MTLKNIKFDLEKFQAGSPIVEKGDDDHLEHSYIGISNYKTGSDIYVIQDANLCFIHASLTDLENRYEMIPVQVVRYVNLFKDRHGKVTVLPDVFANIEAAREKAPTNFYKVAKIVYEEI